MTNTQLDWSQKYRPQSIEDVVLPDELEESIGQLVNNGGGMSMLFYGRPGCGKTTVAKLINPGNTLYINCTTSNSIEMVRQLERSCSSVSLCGGRRLVLLDEGDYLSRDAQAALRGVVEQFSAVNDFIMTANEPERLSPAIISRFYPVHFEFVLDDDMRSDLAKRLWEIAWEECRFDAPLSDRREIVRKCFPDIRMMIKMLQFRVMRQMAEQAVNA